ncbi:Hypothetical protein FKW44_007178, partial [Caligus rogercresseyi]
RRTLLQIELESLGGETANLTELYGQQNYGIIILAAVVGYAAFPTHVADAFGDNWTVASDQIQYFSS